MTSPTSNQEDNLLHHLAHDLVGRDQTIHTPFGQHLLTYADFTASGRALHSIETFLQREVLPFYANTHTTTSATGRRTTHFRDQARKIIADAVHATQDDSVIFVGSGTTAAVHKLVTALGLHVPIAATVKPTERPVVFVGPFEHHSNLLPWRESGADVVMIPEDGRGHVDMDVLTAKLQQFAMRPLKIGAFSAASNITGVLTDVDRVTVALHRYGALAFWDYASCAPYVAIDMNPTTSSLETDADAQAEIETATETKIETAPATKTESTTKTKTKIKTGGETTTGSIATKKTTNETESLAYKDAVYFSGHKFVGGPGSPGVLVVKTRLLKNAVPAVPGGGTVFFVSERDHRYLSHREDREEGGTPDILGSIRLGLAVQTKQRIGAEQIMALERSHVARVRDSFARNEKLVLLGHAGVEQLPIFSFLVRCGDRFLHYNFVSTLLNDLFGIQTRGGCQCAGPYVTRLLGIKSADLVVIERFLVHGVEIIRPGSTRFSIPFFMDEDEVKFILDAIDYVADHGHMFLALYSFTVATGQWVYNGPGDAVPLAEVALADFSITDQPEAIGNHRTAETTRLRRQTLEKARRWASTLTGSSRFGKQHQLPLPCESLRWFAYANDPVAGSQATPIGLFQPQRYVTGDLLRQWDEPLTHVREPSDEYPLRAGRTVVVSVGTEPLKLSRWRRLRMALRNRLRQSRNNSLLLTESTST